MQRSIRGLGVPVLAVALSLGGCTGSFGDNNRQAPEVPAGVAGANGPPAPPPSTSIGASGMRRLSRNEYDNALRDLLGDTSRPGFSRLPEDASDPFDNDYSTQIGSAALIESAEELALQAAARAMKDPARRAALVPCQPAGAEDAACLRSFITTFGRRALRRPLTDAQVERFMALGSYGKETGDFYKAVELVVAGMLQSPQFLYLVEPGRQVAGEKDLFRLDAFERAARLAFFLWGSPPDDALLDRAAQGRLETADEVREAARVLLADPRAEARIARFHALWLGYHQLPHDGALVTAMQEESDALVRTATAPGADYFDLFLSGQTWIGDLLAAHYGMKKPAGKADWIPYGADRRRGILSHGSVLSAFAKGGDTSPTQRGLFVRSRLLCQEIPAPPEDVNADTVPKDDLGKCKTQRYAAHADVGSCRGCHMMMDPIGFGLENYDKAGRFRAHDDGLPECPISGDGALAEVGGFNGPGELGEKLIATGKMESCVARQVFRFALGRHESAADEDSIARLAESFRNGKHELRTLLVELAASDAFTYRMNE